MDFFNVKTVDEARALMVEAFADTALGTETVDIAAANGRILAADVVSAVDVPHFDRSVVDGYAVRTADVQGASETIPAFLRVIGHAEMGCENTAVLGEGDAMYVPTGGMVPRGTQAVVMIEYTKEIGGDEIAVYKNASKYENMLRIGDDIRRGEAVLPRGRALRAQDIGALSSTGHRNIAVYKRPRCAVISTGDEIIAPQSALMPGKINDINTFTVSAQITRFGGDVVMRDVISDDYDRIKTAIQDAVARCDAVFLSGGSSVGNKDYTYQILNEMPGCEILTHGLNIKPGKPTIIARAQGKPVIGLPGQPASALIVLRQMLSALHVVFYGRPETQTYVLARLDQNVAGAPGRTTFQMVALQENDGDEPVAAVLRGKSGMISLLSRADGYIVIGDNQEGMEKGALVNVYPLI